MKVGHELNMIIPLAPLLHPPNLITTCFYYDWFTKPITPQIFAERLGLLISIFLYGLCR